MTYTLEERKPPTTIAHLFEFLEQTNTGRTTIAAPHIHEYFEILYCLDGEFDLLIDNQHFTLSQGDLALIDPMAVHQSFADTDGLNRYLVFKFVPQALTYAEHPLFELKTILPYLWLGVSHIKLYPRTQLEDAGIDALLIDLYHEYTHCPYGYEIALRVGIGRFFLWVLRLWHKSAGDHPPADFGVETVLTLARAMQFIDSHCQTDLTMSDVAEHCGMRYTAFSRFFARYAQKSFPEYLTSMRLKRAAMLLATTHSSVTQIAMDCGFSTASYFISRFRQYNGMSPGEFRRKIWNAQEH